MIGQTVSHYKILEKLGGGGMGVVYKAQDLKLDRFVALKFLPPELTRDAEAKQRFIHEAKAASALQHNNICTVHDIDETDDGQMFIVMDCYGGETLKTKIERGALKIKEAVELAIQIAQGLAEAHQHGIVHRDVKPANILITTNGVLKIVDFGLAKLTTVTKMTKTGSTLGTVAYMAPEQLQGSNVDARADIFSLGVVLYEMLTGKIPFRGEHEAAIMYSIVNEEPIAVRQVNAAVPLSLEAIMLQCLEKNRDRRFKSMENLLGALRDIQVERKNPPSAQRAVSKVVWVIGAILVVAAVAVLYIMPPIGEKAHQRTSIAVLPFKNFSDNQDDEYFSDGVTEEIIASLSKIRWLRVTSRTSTDQYRNVKKSLREIAQELGVGVILEGSVRRTGSRVRITGQLIDAVKDEHIWAETYERESKDIFDIQADVAHRIAVALGGELSSDEKAQLESKLTENLSAHDLYLKGRYFWRRRNPEDLRKATTFFEQAVGLDSIFALAYVGLADCYGLYPFYNMSDISREEAYRRAERNAQKALEINFQLAEAHTSLGNILRRGKWDWDGAERELRLAITLNREYATAHQWYAEMLGQRGRFEESLAEAKRAVDLEPFSPVMQTIYAGPLSRLGRYDEAIAAHKRAIEIDPTFSTPHKSLAALYGIKGMWVEGARELELAGAPPRVSEMYRLVGTDPKRAAMQLQPGWFTGEWQFVLVELYIHLGNLDSAFKLLNRLVDEKNERLPGLLNSPVFAPIFKDTRYKQLVERVGLEK